VPGARDVELAVRVSVAGVAALELVTVSHDPFPMEVVKLVVPVAVMPMD
jgi:hypothetical protein